MGDLLEWSRGSRVGTALPGGALSGLRIGRFVGNELVADAVGVDFPDFGRVGPLKCGETALSSTHAGTVRISRARTTARAHMNCKGGL